MTVIRRNLGWIPVIALSAAPVYFWATVQPLATRFLTPAISLRSLSVVCGLAGISAFSVNLILGARLRFVERWFDGLDRLYRAHRVVGSTAFILLLLHPLLLAYSSAFGSIEAAARVFLPDRDFTLNLGRIAGAALIVAIVLTLFARLKHETFILVQKAMGAVYLVALLHVFRTPGTKALSPALNAYMVALAGAALAAWVYRSVLGRFLVWRHDYRVVEVNRLDPLAVEIVLAPRGEPLEFEPGQFVYVTFLDAGLPRQAHPFSITSAPRERNLRLMVKALGDYTMALMHLQPGGSAKVEGPYGGFTYLESDNPRQIWIAGGIGVTPFLSMARSIDASGYEIDFYYCTDQADQAHFLDELFEIADRSPTLRVIPIRKDWLGYVTADDIEGASMEIARKDIWICGPPVMIEGLGAQFRSMGVPRDQIHVEEFTFL